MNIEGLIRLNANIHLTECMRDTIMDTQALESFIISTLSRQIQNDFIKVAARSIIKSKDDREYRISGYFLSEKALSDLVYEIEGCIRSGFPIIL